MVKHNGSARFAGAGEVTPMFVAVAGPELKAIEK
jgi:hypothetical protein